MRAELIVIDTNVLISYAIKPDGLAGLVADWILKNARLVFSRETFLEFQTRLWRPKFDRYITAKTRESVLFEIAKTAKWVDIEGVLQLSCDPDDDKFIETALVAGASILVSGDSDLLDLRVENLEIMTPRGFEERFIDGGGYRVHEERGEYGVIDAV